MEPVVSDYNKRLILFSLMQLSGGHCIKILVQMLVNRNGVFSATHQVEPLYFAAFGW